MNPVPEVVAEHPIHADPRGAAVRGKGEATLEELIENLNLTEEELRREFAVLRHMEILRGTKKGDKIFYILF